MTPAQKDLLEFIQSYTAEHGLPPSFNEMTAFRGHTSKGNVYRILDALVRAGRITKHAYHTRKYWPADIITFPLQSAEFGWLRSYGSRHGLTPDEAALRIVRYAYQNGSAP